MSLSVKRCSSTSRSWACDWRAWGRFSRIKRPMLRSVFTNKGQRWSSDFSIRKSRRVIVSLALGLQCASRSGSKRGSFALSRVRSTRISLAVGSSRRFSYISRRARFPLQNSTVNPFSLAQPSTACAPPRIIRWGSVRMMSFSPLRGLSLSMTHCSSIGCTASGSEPVIEPQAGDVLEIRRVVRHQCQVVDKGHRSNHQVHPTDRYSLLEQGSPHMAELMGAGRVKIENVDFLEQAGHQGQQFCRVRVFVSACVQLTQDDGRNGQTARVLNKPVCETGGPAHVRRARICIEQEDHFGSSLRESFLRSL